MRKIVVSPFMSLDGVIQAPGEPDEIEHGGWMIPYNNKESLNHTFAELNAADAILLGRVSYNLLAADWPTMSDEWLIEGFSARMNGIRKYVISKSLTEASWNNTQLLQGDLTQEITRLKQEGDRDIVVVGSCDLIHSLQQLDLIDEYRFMVAPVVVGNGKRLFREGIHIKALSLKETKAFSNGVTVFTYQPENHQ